MKVALKTEAFCCRYTPMIRIGPSGPKRSSRGPEPRTFRLRAKPAPISRRRTGQCVVPLRNVIRQDESLSLWRGAFRLRGVSVTVCSAACEPSHGECDDAPDHDPPGPRNLGPEP